MFSIQSMMLVALGFLAATLLALIVAPAFWSRAVRLTTQRIKDTLPISEQEIRADKDRLRAEYAIRVHKLEMKVEQAALQKARQLIEINRRDGTISGLEAQLEQVNATLEENMNARRVLEQTVADRLPKIEHRLTEAKTLLFDRDREIAELTSSARRQQLTLDEAASINAQQNAEVERLKTALTVRGARNQNTLADPTFDGEVALRSELEALRAKTREQAAVISRMQSQMARTSGTSAESGRSRLITADQSSEAPKAALVAVAQVVDAKPEFERELRALRAKSDDQAAEIARLQAELAAFKDQAGDDGGIKDSKMALKARLSGSQAQVEEQTEMIRRLRAELAAANERLALQGAHFMEQMRRLGAGTLPAAGQSRKPVLQGGSKPTLTERVALQRAGAIRPVVNGAAADEAEVEVVASGQRETEAVSEAPAPAAAKPRLIDRISSVNKA